MGVNKSSTFVKKSDFVSFKVYLKFLHMCTKLWRRQPDVIARVTYQQKGSNYGRTFNRTVMVIDPDVAGLNLFLAKALPNGP